MSQWKKALVVNAGALIGITISLFIVPATTPTWLWVVVAVVSLMVLNYVFVVWRRTGSDPHRKPSGSTVVICLGCVVLLLDLVFRYLHH